MKEAKSRAKDSNKKKAFGKGIKRALISLIAFAVITALVAFLNKAGIDISAEEKKELVNMIIQILLGGGLLSFGSFAAANLTKKHNEK